MRGRLSGGAVGSPSMERTGMSPHAVPVMKTSRVGPMRSVGSMCASSMMWKPSFCAAFRTSCRVSPTRAY